MPKSKFRQEIENILRQGITAYGTRYALQCRLVYHYWSQAYSEDECYQLVRGWYLKHSHRSKDWEKDPDLVFRHLKNAIASFYRNASSRGYKPQSWEKKRLRISDVINIVQMTPDYRNQKFIFSLMEYALNMKNAKGEFRLPRIVITTFDCCSDRSYQEKMRFCESIGLIIKVRDYYRQERRARTYVINYEFSNHGIPVCNLEQGLTQIFNLNDLRLRYSRWVYSKILREG